MGFVGVRLEDGVAESVPWGRRSAWGPMCLSGSAGGFGIRKGPSCLTVLPVGALLVSGHIDVSLPCGEIGDKMPWAGARGSGRSGADGRKMRERFWWSSHGLCAPTP